MRLEVIVNPAREHGRFHRRAPRLWQRFHPQVQIKACGGKRSFGENLATAILHAVADLPLVNIQSDVIHRFHGGASFGVSESASAEFSFSTPSAPPSTYTFKLDYHHESHRQISFWFRVASQVSGRCPPAESGLYLRVEREAMRSTGSVVFF